MPFYKDVFLFFLKLGALGFGGPLALVSHMQKHCVEEEHWLSNEEFTSTFALIKAMPGPLAFMTAVFLGRRRAGVGGAFLAGLALNLPAFFLMVLFSIFFDRLSHLDFIRPLMLGMQVCALGVILGSLKGLIKGNEKKTSFWLLVAVSGTINYFYPSLEPVIILGFGLMMITSKALFDFGTMILVFFKAGAVVFGSGLAIVPMLENDVVARYHWLSHSEFLDALAFGQMTPGPVVITATYIGQKMYGFPGALAATVAIFSASFFHMVTWFPLLMEKLKGRAFINQFIFGALAAVVGPILVAVLKLARGIELTPFLLLLMAVSFVMSLKGKFPMWLIIPLGGVASLLYMEILKFF